MSFRKSLLLLALVTLLGVAVLIAVHTIGQKYDSKDGAQYLISMGDSVAAGDGLPLVSHSSNEDSVCYRSDDAYPVYLARALHVQLRQYACSGAKVSTGILEPQMAGSMSIPAQLQRALPYVRGNDVVITIGANDVGWSDLLTRCAQSDCTGIVPSEYRQGMDQLQAGLEQMLGSLQAAQPRRIIVNQYYSLLAATDSCYDVYGITAAKISWVNARKTELNDNIAVTTRRHNAQIVPIDFEGHELCDTDDWIQNLLDKAPLHPTQDGQEQIAAQDLKALLDNR